MAPNQPRLLALSLEVRQGLHSLRSAYADGTLTPEVLARAVSRLTSMKSRALAIHGELEGAGVLASSRFAEARRTFGSIWTDVRETHAALDLARRELGVAPPRPTRIDATWQALKSKFVAGWPRAVLPPLLRGARPGPERAREAAAPGAELGGLDCRPDARCPVCAEEAGAGARRCPRCEAVHHPECWDWAGGCGIYGCRRVRRA